MKKITKFFIGLIALLLVGYWAVSSYYRPQYSGDLTLEGLSDPVEVYYDQMGIPHIEAQSNEDAYKALGYVHAQDRLWQMELMRRIAPGRLSEVLGEATVETDKFFKALNLEQYHEKSLAFLEKDEAYYQMTMAYLDGVNEFIKSGPTPVEFSILGIEKESYTVKDILNVIGYMSFSFSDAQKVDPLLSAIRQDLGDAYAGTLDGSIDPNSTLIHNFKQDLAVDLNYSNQVAQIMENLPVPAFIGSNSWVVGPQKTEEGKVIFANDPHIGYAQPGVWFQAHVKTADYEMYGFHLGLVPFPLLAHNRSYAYGLTMFLNDDMNFFALEQDSNEANTYRYGEEIKEFTKQSHTVKVKGGESVDFEVRQSIHGPVMNDFLPIIETDVPVSVSWVYTERDNHLLEALYGISHAENMSSFKEGASLIHAPGLNVMYGDAQDNIAWWASAKLYKMKNRVSTMEILNGSNAEDDQLTWLDFEGNPMAINPSWNYVYSANNQPDSIHGMLYPGYYLPEDRAKRIVELLEEDTLQSRSTMARMIGDVTSAVAPGLIELLVEAMPGEQSELLSKLAGWNGAFDKEAIEPTLYTKFYFELFKNSMKDELGEAKFESFMNTHLQKRFAADLFSNANSIWWDDISTPNKESREEILVLSWDKAMNSLTVQLGDDPKLWKWGSVHQLTHEHVMKDVPLLGSLLDVGPFEISGGNEVINNQLYKLDDSGLYPVNAGPSSRRIIDFSNIEQSLGMIPTGQSGNPWSPYYDNTKELFVNNEFYTMLLNQEQIHRESTLLVLNPKN